MEGPGNAYADTYLRWKKRFVLENFREHGQRWRDENPRKARRHESEDRGFESSARKGFFSSISI